jgi:AraC-like DNA-binding protein
MSPINERKGVGRVTDEARPVARMYVWRDRLAYLAVDAIPLREFTIDTDQLIVALSGYMNFYAEPAHKAEPDKYPPAITTRTVLLPAGTKVNPSRVDSSGAVLAICYLNTVGEDLDAIIPKMRIAFDGIYYQHRDEETVVEQLRRIRNERIVAEDAHKVVEQLIFGEADLGSRPKSSVDPRIIRVTDLIKSTVRENLSIEELAQRVHLSESRLTKLFRSQVGIPITRYRLGYRVFVGYVYLALGYSVTEAALASGFSSTAHFSRCFTESIGIQPSAKLLRPPFVDVLIDPEIVQTVAEKAGRFPSE